MKQILRTQIKELIFMLLALICAVIITYGIIFYLNRVLQMPAEVSGALAGVIASMLAVGMYNHFHNYFSTKRLRYSLLTEVGLIARALFEDVETNKWCANKKIMETFEVDHAVIHSVGESINLLNEECAEDILEFHSLMKVLRNKCSKENCTKDETEKVLKKIVGIVSKYSESSRYVNGTKGDGCEEYVRLLKTMENEK